MKVSLVIAVVASLFVGVIATCSSPPAPDLVPAPIEVPSHPPEPASPDPVKPLILPPDAGTIADLGGGGVPAFHHQRADARPPVDAAPPSPPSPPPVDAGRPVDAAPPPIPPRPRPVDARLPMR